MATRAQKHKNKNIQPVRLHPNIRLLWKTELSKNIFKEEIKIYSATNYFVILSSVTLQMRMIIVVVIIIIMFVSNYRKCGNLMAGIDGHHAKY